MTHEDDPRLQSAIVLESKVRAIQQFLHAAELVQEFVDVRPSTAASLERTLTAYRMEQLRQAKEASQLRRRARDEGGPEACGGVHSGSPGRGGMPGRREAV
jgi:hypothetical protein